MKTSTAEFLGTGTVGRPGVMAPTVRGQVRGRRNPSHGHFETPAPGFSVQTAFPILLLPPPPPDFLVTGQSTPGGQLWGSAVAVVFPAETVSLNTKLPRTADWGGGGGGGGRGRLRVQGCLHGLSTLPSLETNLECAPEIHTQAVGGPLWSIYTPSAKAEGKAVRVGQLLLFPSVGGSPGLAASARRQAGGVPVYPASS